ncbi:GntR family transcriptional regulator [Microbacterium sp. PAMC22086]|uniref:GntR family transcriptional regulator n=1 Tax=Microbacterium sp. PAMC22086 TaxID=2861281 RepID=UPI001C6252FD|nr:GntR family transcriptional regulator [Microbacterium sp. PAMC22086]QYG11529.1 GntR family transcriptional regulator [Microbacterium sp. PAMC22086]
MRTILRRETIAERSAELLRDRILSGELRPGDLVTEEAMANEIGISRPTMREVLNTMVIEGLLTRSPTTRVLHVTSVTAKEIREGFIARRLIELAAVDAAISASPDAIDTLASATADVVAAVESGDGPAVTRADIACHMATVALLGSTDLVEFYGRLLTRLEIAMAEGMRAPVDVANAKDVHVEFLDLLRAGHYPQARAQLAERLDASEKSLLQYVKEDES